MTKQTLTVKNMIREYYNAKADMDTVWNTFHSMYLMNFITWEEWSKFFEKCKSWTYDPDENIVIDCSTDKEVNLYKAPKGA